VPTTIAEAFATVALVREGVVKWGTKPTTSEAGVYVVSLTEHLDTCDGKLTEAPLSETEFQRWLTKRSELTLGGIRPTLPQLMDRLSSLDYLREILPCGSRAPAHCPAAIRVPSVRRVLARRHNYPRSRPRFTRSAFILSSGIPTSLRRDSEIRPSQKS
jgi:hypothetical protein